MFGLEYDSAHQRHAAFNPGFKFAGLPGADLVVVGVLNPEAHLEDIEEAEKNPSVMARSFFRDILNPAILTLSTDHRTRRHNLAQTGQRFLPRYYRLYREDLTALSAAVVGVMRIRARDVLYKFYFGMASSS